MQMSWHMRFPTFICLASLACGSDDTTTAPACDADCGGTDAQTESGSEGGVDSAPPPKCGTGGWLTYGHDAARTFASDGCINGPLAPSWTYSPAPPSGHTVNAVYHAVAAADAVYLQWAASDGVYVGTTAADRVSPAGARVWTYDTGSDANMGNWASVSGTSLVINDDGVYFPDLTTGKSAVGTGVDWWGQSIADGSGGVWFADTSKSDGPGLFVGELDSMAKTLWKQNVQGTMCGDGLSDQMGGIALDGGVLFYAPLYVTGSSVQPTFKSGLYAFDSVKGTPKWNIASTPASAISAGNGFVYGIEAGAVVARSEADGSKGWSQPLPGAGAQAPVLVNGLAIAAGSSGVSAFDAKSGAPQWSVPISGAAASAYQMQISNGCSGLQDLGAAIATSLAAAVPSGTLVVTASDGIHVVSLSTGEDKWHGPVAGAKHPVHDPVIVGNVLYVVDSPPGGVAGFGPGQLIALTGS
jgi:hypothetical protein